MHSCTASYNPSFFFNDTATTEIYTLSLHDALPILRSSTWPTISGSLPRAVKCASCHLPACARSEEHTSELQSLAYLVCRLLLEKKKTKKFLDYSQDDTLHSLVSHNLICMSDANVCP